MLQPSQRGSIIWVKNQGIQSCFHETTFQGVLSYFYCYTLNLYFDYLLSQKHQNIFKVGHLLTPKKKINLIKIPFQIFKNIYLFIYLNSLIIVHSYLPLSFMITSQLNIIISLRRSLSTRPITYKCERIVHKKL